MNTKKHYIKEWLKQKKRLGVRKCLDQKTTILNKVEPHRLDSCMTPEPENKQNSLKKKFQEPLNSLSLPCLSKRMLL